MFRLPPWTCCHKQPHPLCPAKLPVWLCSSVLGQPCEVVCSLVQARSLSRSSPLLIELSSTPSFLSWCIHTAQNQQQLWFQDAAELLAAKADWGPLYDSAVLSQNQVPVASATYFEVTPPLSFPWRLELTCWLFQLQQPAYHHTALLLTLDATLCEYPFPTPL